MVKKDQEFVQTTIRIPREVWIKLRRLQEVDKIKSINHEAIKHFKEITEEDK